jgi:hypothetical protein
VVGRKGDIVVTQGTPAAISAKQATTKTPIHGHRWRSGPRSRGKLLTAGGNITGSSFFFHEINAKRLELMKTVMPALAHGGVLSNPDNPRRATARKGKPRGDDDVGHFGVKLDVSLPFRFEDVRDWQAKESQPAATFRTMISGMSEAGQAAAGRLPPRPLSAQGRPLHA